jgi:molybdenum cofactor synthesis domain-containing protein
LKLKITVVTISDRSYYQEREDLTGPQLFRYLGENADYEIQYRLIDDDLNRITELLIHLTDLHQQDLVLTCGGTGFAMRDVTPEATRRVIQKEAPGIMEMIRFENAKFHSRSWLSRGICGIRNRTVILNLPGSPEGSLSNFKIFEHYMGHIFELLNSEKLNCAMP